MGDDPYISDVINEATSHGSGSAATGGSSYTFHYGLSKEGSLWVVVIACLALGLSLGAVLIFAIGQGRQKDLIDAGVRRSMDAIQASERRAMDYAYLAKQEARIAQDKVQELEIKLKEK